MTHFDVFNGDADGICSLQQLRLDNDIETTLVTGVKRDINLLKKVNAAEGDEIITLDVSLDKNREALVSLLEAGANIKYFDHHFAGEIPQHVNLETHIDPTPDIGTSLLVDAYLEGRQKAWAIVGTFGDNFDQSALKAAASLGYTDDQLDSLKELGICINYNGYGATIDDLHFAPDDLYKKLHPYSDPLDFINEDTSFTRLKEGYYGDMEKAAEIKPEVLTDSTGIYIMPAQPWARRVSGVYANNLAQATTSRAHALLTKLDEGGFVVSVRAPLDTKSGADDLCRQFETGGGRKAAAGINRLPESDFDLFSQKFSEIFSNS